MKKNIKAIIALKLLSFVLTPTIFGAESMPQEQIIVANGAIVNEEGKILVIQRSKEEGFLPGYYDLTGGKVDPREQVHEGAIREALEESQIETTVEAKHIEWSYEEDYKGKKTTFIVHGFILRPKNPDCVVKTEKGQHHRWISAEEIDSIKITDRLKDEIKSAFKWVQTIDSIKQKIIDDSIQRVVVGMVVNHQDSFLILKRKANDFMPNLWEIPSGKVEQDETMFAAIKRELKEETNLDLTSAIKYLGYFDYNSNSGKKTRQINFKIDATGNFKEIKHPEHQDFKWIPPSKIDDYEISHEVKNLLK